MTEPEKTHEGHDEADRLNRRRTLVGKVTSDKMNKTRRVEVTRLTKHPKYGKFLRQRKVYHVHDEANESHSGDEVEIMETRPLSKTKRWRLVKILRSVSSATNATEST